MTARDPIQITEAELVEMTNDLDGMHHDAMPRMYAAVAEWADGKLTVWTATQNPFGVRGELAQAFRLNDDAVHVIVPDFGSGYGGKHTGEVAIEAARLGKKALLARPEIANKLARSIPNAREWFLAPTIC